MKQLKVHLSKKRYYYNDDKATTEEKPIDNEEAMDEDNLETKTENKLAFVPGVIVKVKLKEQIYEAKKIKVPNQN